MSSRNDTSAKKRQESEVPRSTKAELETTSDVPSETSPQRSPPDDYRAALSRLVHAAEHLAALRENETKLRAETTQAIAEREDYLEKSAKLSGEPDFEQASRLSTKVEVSQRRIALLAAEIEAAETELSAELAMVASRFSALYRVLYLWFFEKEKTWLTQQTTGNAAQAALEHVVWNLRKVADIRKLEIFSTDLEAVRAQAARLLETVGSADGFLVPPYAPEAPAEAAAGSEEVDPPCPPRGDMGVDVPRVLEEIGRNNPGIPLALALRELYKMHPQIFVPVPNEPLPNPRSGLWPAGMVGSTSTDTREPAYA